MISTRGAIPPLHRKYDEALSMRLIRNRYVNCRQQIPKQVRALQDDENFRTFAADRYYANSYKDWHILLIVFNIMLNVSAKDELRSGFLEMSKEKIMSQAHALSDCVFPSELFMSKRVRFIENTAFLACLESYGFAPRPGRIDDDAMLRFMKDRLNFFELDLPHVPMFGNPPGDWPDL